jgi:hypothetical protein
VRTLCLVILLCVPLPIASGADVVPAPRVGPARGFYDAPFVLTLSCDAPDAVIRYTTDGTRPTEATGQLYAGPISIDSTTCLRAAAFNAGSAPSPVQTHTYIFLEQVLQQSSCPPGFPATWGSTVADYEMDPEIVNDAAYRPQMVASLKSLPTMSLVMSLDDLFGAQGIYTNWEGSGDEWERSGSVEWIDPNDPEDAAGFQIDCGIRIYGGVGRRGAKKSFRLKFTREYGPTKLRYPLFGPDAADSFDQIILRAGFNDTYTWGGGRSQYIRDEYVRRLQQALGHPAAHGCFVHLYVNGVYWGLYNSTERPEASFAATYFGGDKEDWDALNSGRPVGDSSTAGWNAFLDLVRQGAESDAAWQRLQGNNPDGTPNPHYIPYLDVDNYIDYLLVNFFAGNRDWPAENWYAAMNRAEPTGWKFFAWDAECVIGMNSGLAEDVTGEDSGVCEPYAALRANPEFLQSSVDRIHAAFSDGGPLYVDPLSPQWDPNHPERNRPAALYADLADQVEPAMLAESARWGDVVSGSPCRIEQWRSQRDWILNTYMSQRPAIVLDQFRGAGMYP